jgi:hypothetical protein
MSIAQHSVAGEDGTHPHDAEAFNAYISDAINLPWVIFRAAFRASHVEDLPQRARALLAALARTVDKSKPFGAIFARRELLTGRAMQSMRTFYRSLDDLESAGLIDRRPQSRYIDAGLFGRSYLHLTERAVRLLGLVEAPVAEEKQAEQVSLIQPSANVADGAIYKDLYPASFQKRQPGQVPEDLQRLRSLGFLDFLIFKLMREARQHGKRLSDVVEVTWQHLKAARAPICYLRALLRNPTDFAYQIRVKSQANEAAVRRRELKQEAARCAQAYAGQAFVDVQGETTYMVAEDGMSMTIYKANEGVGRQAINWHQGLVRAIEQGSIRKSTAVLPVTVKPTPPATARNHIASLRGLLRTRAFNEVAGKAHPRDGG